MSRRAGHNGRPLLEVPMLLRGLTWLVLFQLLGTGLNVLLLPMLPGPIIGLVLLFGYFLARGEVGKPVTLPEPDERRDGSGSPLPAPIIGIG